MSYTDGADFFVLAHRGGPGDKFRENSLDAFRHAVGLGCNYLETDARLANDGKLYLAHDATSWLPNQILKPDNDAVTLEQLFEACPNAYFAIDPKHSRAVEPLAELIVKTNMAQRVCIGASFDGRAQKVADLVRRETGVCPATAFVSAAASLDVLLKTTMLREKRQSFIHVHRRLISEAVVHNAHTRNLRLIAWVVNDKTTMLRLKKLGVDGFMTDYPQLAKEAGLLVQGR